MIIDAQLSGSLVPGGEGQGEVISVHRGFMNLLTQDGLIVSLLHSTDDMHPFGILLATVDFGSIPVKARDPVEFDKDRLLVGSETVVSLHKSGRWAGDATHARVPASADTAATFKEAVIEYSDNKGFAPLVSGYDGDRFTSKAAEVLQGASVQNGKIDVSGLIGLGIGLTPSGDDFIAGALLAEVTYAHTPSAAQVPEIHREAVGKALKKTVPAGRTLLTGALQEQFPQYLLDLGKLIIGERNTDQDIRAAVGTAAGHGATSGTDSCAGIWWYLDRFLIG